MAILGEEFMNIWVTLCSSLLSGLVGIGVSTAYYRRYENRKMKLDLIRRLAATRYQIAGTGVAAGSDGFFSALNELFVVFHDEPRVIAAIETFRKELDRPENVENNIPTLFRELFKSVGLKNDFLNDSIIMKPFTPGPALQAAATRCKQG